MLDEKAMKKRSRHQKDVVSIIPLEGNVKWICILERWAEWAVGGFGTNNYSEYLAKLTYKRQEKELLLGWFLVDACQSKAKATESILKVQELEGDKIQVDYRTAVGTEIQDKSQVYKFNGNAYVPE